MSHAKLLAAAAAVAVFPSVSSAATQIYQANLQPLNGSGVSGLATLTVDTVANTLTVQINAAGLTPNQVHPQHVHGRFQGAPGGDPLDSVVPPPAADTDGDGFIEVLEGAPFYGPIILPLTSPPSTFPNATGFPVASAAGTVNFSQIYDLDNDDAFFDPIGGINFDSEDVFPLPLREIVLHGMVVDEGLGEGTPGEVDGTGGYLVTLPVAAGEIVLIPLPAAAWAGLTGLAGVVGHAALRRRRSPANL